jgi:hypothetical protein
MHVVITGATGLIGRPLARALVTAGHDVTALTRNVARAERLLPVRCIGKEWSPTGPVAPDLLRGVDAVVHLAGEGVADRRWTTERKQTIRDSRVYGTRALVDAMASLPNTERPRVVVSASAIGYYGDRGDEQLDERSPPGRDFLAEVCAAWEHEAFKAAALGVRVVAVRIGIVLSSDGGALAKMLLPFRLGAGGRVGSGRQWMSWIHVADLVALFTFALDNPTVSGPVNGVAPEPVVNRTFTAELGRALQRPALVPLPVFALRLAFGEMSSVLLASQRVSPAAAERLGFRFQHPRLPGALAEIVSHLLT